jgi:hypothetical protein
MKTFAKAVVLIVSLLALSAGFHVVGHSPATHRCRPDVLRLAEGQAVCGASLNCSS